MDVFDAWRFVAWHLKSLEILLNIKDIHLVTHVYILASHIFVSHFSACHFLCKHALDGRI